MSVPQAQGSDLTIDLAAVLGAFGNAAGAVSATEASVYDVWGEKALGSFTGSFTAKNISHHGTAFLRMTPKKSGVETAGLP